MLRRTVSHGKRFGSWKDKAPLCAWRGDWLVLYQNSPSVARIRPATRRSRVDFRNRWAHDRYELPSRDEERHPV